MSGPHCYVPVSGDDMIPTGKEEAWIPFRRVLGQDNVFVTVFKEVKICRSTYKMEGTVMGSPGDAFFFAASTTVIDHVQYLTQPNMDPRVRFPIIQYAFGRILIF